VLRATEHLLQRLHGAALQPRPAPHLRRLPPSGGPGPRGGGAPPGRGRARRRAAAEMEPLNAYERRVVHVSLQGEAGVNHLQRGGGSARRVTVAPASPGVPEAPDGGE